MRGKLHSEKLVVRAQTGEKLGAAERRIAVAFMMSTHPEDSNVALADIFQVTERTIREDKAYIRGEAARTVKEDDIALVIGDIVLNFERQIRDIEAGKRCKECKPGTRTYLEYCKALFNLEIQKMEALQQLGYYPHDLGTMTVQKFEFKASVGLMEEKKTMEAAPARNVEAIDAEFLDLPIKMLPAPVASTEASNVEQADLGEAT